MAKSYRREKFEELMAELEGVDPRVKTYLAEVGFNKWARCYAPVNRGRMTTSNIAECINVCLVEVRRLPFIEFLEKARELFAKWNVNGEKTRYMWDEILGSRFQDILMKNEIRSVRLRAVKSSEFIYSVDSDGIRYIICLENKTCTCNRFQYDGIPCEHAIAVLRSKSITDLMPYCSSYYRKDTLENIYKNSFSPMPLKK